MKNATALHILPVCALLAAGTLACQAAPLARFFASPTPTATFTPIPTSTPTSTPTPSATPIPTNTPTPPPSGVEVVDLADSSTQFIDHDNRYQLTLPMDWLIVPVNQKDLQASLDKAAQNNPEFADLADGFRDIDPDTFRGVAFNTQRKLVDASSPTFLMILTISDPVAGSMPMDFVTAMIEDNILKGAKIISWDVKTNSSGIEIGINDAANNMPLPTGNTVYVRTKIISFQANRKLILVQCFTPAKFGDEVLPPLEDIIDTIELTTP